MIASLVLSKPLTIGVNTNNKFAVDGKTFSISDVPAIRYRFSSDEVESVCVEGSESYRCIKKHMEIFNKSVHIIEIPLSSEAARIVADINNKFERLAVFVYVDIRNENVGVEDLSEEDYSYLSGLFGLRIDRVVMKDNSDMLYTVVYNKLVARIAKLTGISKNNIGVCESPLSTGENCCLTARRTRELAAKYGEVADMVLPSANHEGKNYSTCGCIRHIVVRSSTTEPAIKSAGSGSGVKKSKAEDSDTDGSNNEHNKAKKKVSKVIMPW